MSLIDIKNKLETKFSAERYALMKMLDTDFKEMSLMNLNYESHFDGDIYTVKIYNKHNPNEYCIIICNKYITTIGELVYITDDRLVILNNEDIIFNKEIPGLKNICSIQGMLVGYEYNNETIFVNTRTGKEELRIEGNCVRLYTHYKNWSTLTGNGIQLYTCRDLAIITTEHYNKSSNNNLILKVIQNIRDIHKTKYIEQSCIYDIGFVHNDIHYYIRGQKIYTLEELLKSLKVKLIDKVTDGDTIIKYIVESESGLTGEMTNDFRQIKFGKTYIKSSIYDENTYSNHIINVINSKII